MAASRGILRDSTAFSFLAPQLAPQWKRCDDRILRATSFSFCAGHVCLSPCRKRFTSHIMLCPVLVALVGRIRRVDNNHFIFHRPLKYSIRHQRKMLHNYTRRSIWPQILISPLPCPTTR